MDYTRDIPRVKRRACVVCTAAKAKCTPYSIGLCQRCQRLGKPCKYLDLPERKKDKRRPKRIDELQSKVDRVVSQLNVLANQNSTPIASLATNPSSISSGPVFQDTEPDPPGIALLLEAANDDAHGPAPTRTSTVDATPSIVAQGWMTLNEAEHLIQEFRSCFIPVFPFVVLDLDDTAARLLEEQPFLFLCIIVATMPSGHRERARVIEEIMAQVTSRVIVGSERNLDLLRGLIVHCAWYSYPAERNHRRLMLFVQLCATIVYDLGLHLNENLTRHEQRALLGTYWLSIGASGLGRPVAMKYDQSIEDSVRSLEESMEHASDGWIRPFIQLQSFVLEIDDRYSAISSRNLAYSAESSANTMNGSLLRQLQTLRQSFEHDLPMFPDSTKRTLESSLHSIQMSIGKIATRDDLWTQPEPPGNRTSESFGSPTFRTLMLWDLLKQSKAFIQTFINLPEAEVPVLGVFTVARLCMAVVALHKSVSTLLGLLRGHDTSPRTLNPGQRSEAQAIINEADYISLVAASVKKLDIRLQGLSDEDREYDVVGSLRSKLRLLAYCYPYRVKAILGEDLVHHSTATSQADADAIPVRPAVACQANTWPGLSRQADWSLPSPSLEDTTFMLDDAQWASALDSFAGFS